MSETDPVTSPRPSDPPSKLDWVYTAKGKRLLWGVLLGACVLSFMVELVHWVATGGFAVGTGGESGPMPGGFALLGFVSCTIMIYAAKWLGRILKVRPDFYGKEESSDDA